MQAAIIADNAGTVGEVIHRIWPARSDSTSHMPRSLGHAGRYTFGAPPLILSHMSPCRGWMRNILGSMAGVLRFSYIARSLMCRQVKTTEGFIGAMFRGAPSRVGRLPDAPVLLDQAVGLQFREEAVQQRRGKV